MIALALLAAGACSPRDDGPSGPASSTTTATTVVTTSTTTRPTAGAAVAAFAACMDGAGVPIPDVRLDATSAPLLGDLLADLDPADPVVREALTACAGPLAASGLLDVATDPELRRAVVDRLGAYAHCMRREGIAGFPDPVPGFDGSGTPFPPEQVPSGSVGFDEAATVCAAEVAAADEG